MIKDLVSRAFILAAFTNPLAAATERGKVAQPALPDMNFSSQEATQRTIQMFDDGVGSRYALDNASSVVSASGF